MGLTIRLGSMEPPLSRLVIEGSQMNGLTWRCVLEDQTCSPFAAAHGRDQEEQPAETLEHGMEIENVQSPASSGTVDGRGVVQSPTESEAKEVERDIVVGGEEGANGMQAVSEHMGWTSMNSLLTSCIDPNLSLHWTFIAPATILPPALPSGNIVELPFIMLPIIRNYDLLQNYDWKTASWELDGIKASSTTR
ncbi:hypothetical protein D9613_006455 [Agrocybe pediades]|uniref:Uncharacterized protein n=1 Tax=Agrocybe pediades TaxID=84607 RepID=A0A8H4VKF7_9AGAR|nr:hypothetical protein D9613_006455 [Agrocybe pediades]